MGCLSSNQITEIKAQIATLDAQILAANTALTAAVGNSEIEEYRFNSGDGNQAAIRRDPNQILKTIDTLTARRDRLQRRLNGTSNVNMNLRRLRGRHGIHR